MSNQYCLVRAPSRCFRFALHNGRLQYAAMVRDVPTAAIRRRAASHAEPEVACRMTIPVRYIHAMI